jgi:DNA-binding response OmpR family regulator
LVLLDLNIPLISGHEVLTALKANTPLNVIPVIVLTTSSNPDDIRRAYGLGASCYIVKPHDFADFLSVCRALYSFWFKRVTLPHAQAAGTA